MGSLSKRCKFILEQSDNQYTYTLTIDIEQHSIECAFLISKRLVSKPSWILFEITNKLSDSE